MRRAAWLRIVRANAVRPPPLEGISARRAGMLKA